MAKYKRVLCAILAFLLVFSLGSFVSVPAHAIVLDPVAWLYPIWQAYAMQAGITVTTVGGDSFTQDSFTGLFNEWQAFEVSQGVQSAAQSISGFVDDAVNFVEVVAGSGSGGVLNTILKLDAGIVGPLSRFWNWIVTEKLGGSSVDSTDFDSTTGNLAISSSLFDGQPLGLTPDSAFSVGPHSFVSYSSDKPVYLFAVGGGSSYFGVLCSEYSGAHFTRYEGASSLGTYSCNYYNETTQLFYTRMQNGQYTYVGSLTPVFDSIDEGRAALRSHLNGGSLSGSISVAPDVGVDVLGFPDTRNPDYVPADTNIGWNVPYDPTADTNAYLDQAYQQALDNELDESGTIDDPVTGTDEVGEVGEYVVPGLSEVFPFCIPFDVYNFLSALAADPVAPSFTAELAFPEQLGGSRYIEIDLDNSTFNQLASILRTMELLLFIVGLAYVTRSKFIRG